MLQSQEVEMNLAKIDKIKREGSKLLEIQNKIIVNMNIARQKYNDVLLTIDKILFDNIIMLDKIMKKKDLKEFIYIISLNYYPNINRRKMKVHIW